MGLLSDIIDYFNPLPEPFYTDNDNDYPEDRNSDDQDNAGSYDTNGSEEG